MKKLLTVALSCAMLLSVSALASAGDRGHLRTGITAGFTSSSANPKNWDASSLGRFHAGFTMQIPIALGFAVQPAVVYQAKGTKLDGSRIEDGTELPADMNAKVSYVEIPVQIQWGPDLVALRPYVFAEPFVGYGLHAKASSYPMECPSRPLLSARQASPDGNTVWDSVRASISGDFRPPSSISGISALCTMIPASSTTSAARSGMRSRMGAISTE